MNPNGPFANANVAQAIIPKHAMKKDIFRISHLPLAYAHFLTLS
jgi:hypothetical protein